jgi:peptidoglycan/xylan/chitin deacetylase (PgdA/CDA1 family)
MAVYVRDVRDRPDLAWAAGRTFKLPASVLASTDLLGRAGRQGGVTIDATLPRPAADDAHRLRLRNAFTEERPASARLPFSYRWVPGVVRHSVACIIGRRVRSREDRWADFPGWPLDQSADFLADLCARSTAPAADRTPVLLTHDIDSAEGLTNLVRVFLPLEEAVGARSTNFVVPCAWPLDYGALAECTARGHEIGIHGFDHRNRTCFAAPAERAARLAAGARLGRTHAARGYRAPSLLRTPELLHDLAAHYDYDSSIPTSGGPFPTPNNGCASARPFLIGPLLEIPLSLPRDGSLRFLGYSERDILRLWLQCADLIADGRGVVVLLTHCEARFSGNPAMLGAYRELLKHFRCSSRFAWATGSQLASAVSVAA